MTDDLKPGDIVYIKHDLKPLVNLLASLGYGAVLYDDVNPVEAAVEVITDLRAKRKKARRKLRRARKALADAIDAAKTCGLLVLTGIAPPEMTECGLSSGHEGDCVPYASLRRRT